MKEAASTSEKSVNFSQTTRFDNPEDIHLQTRRRENLKSHWLIIWLWIQNDMKEKSFGLFNYLPEGTE
jgi:hypothetical protein